MTCLRTIALGVLLSVTSVALGQSAPATPANPMTADPGWRYWLEQRAAMARQLPQFYSGVPQTNPNPAAADAAWLGYSSSGRAGQFPPPNLYPYGTYPPYGMNVPPYLSYPPLYVFPR